MRAVVLVHFLVMYGFAQTLPAFGEATPADAIEIRDGFVVERIYSVPREQGSWVAMCFDDKGRIYASDQGMRLFRITPPAPGQTSESIVELVSDQWGFSQGMTFLHGALYVVQHGDHSESSFRPDVLLRIKDTNADDKLDTAEQLIEFPRVTGDAANWVEHSLHAVVPGPDGQSLYIVSGDRNGLPCENGRTPKHWNRDSWEFQFTPQPYSGGWVMRTDLNGKKPEYLCMGLRNSYDLAFNRSGDLFTYDSDLENDIGLPNYRPTAIRQVLSGTDSGWHGRAGEMLWSWTSTWEDIQPPLRNIGPGSPTGICFGYGAKFPARYQNALFACDWSYGRMFAVALTPSGASYSAEPEPFLSAQGLPIADVAVSPLDGALYFLTGGRGTQSAVYRVTYAGTESTAAASEPLPDAATTAAQQLRRRLESFHGHADLQAIEALWPHLADNDRAIRSAARVALEWQPVSEWKHRALQETNPRMALQAMLALTRSTDGDTSIQSEFLAALDRMNFAKLNTDEQSWYLRIITVSAIRHGRYDEAASARLVAKLEPSIPSRDRRVNEELVALCTALKSPTMIAPALDLLEQSRTQEEQVLYVQALTSLHQSPAWTPELRERFLKLAMERVPIWKGGFTARARRDQMIHAVTQMLTVPERQAFAELIASAQKPPAVIPATTRTFVQKWNMDDLVPTMEANLTDPRNVENGRKLFSAAACIVCHSFQGEGGLGGPDLTSVGGRYSAQDLLDNIINPSKVINEQFSLQTYLLKDGRTHTGRTVNMAGDIVMVATNPNDPGGSEVRFSINDLESTTPSRVSFMPEGLLNTLSQEDILDLIAYLRQR
jgi:putative heme-binding domain-containing protein